MRAALALIGALMLAGPALSQSAEPAAVPAARPDDRSIGSAEAPVTLTAYLSTTCSHCADWHTNALPAIRARFVDTGQVRIVFRDLPTQPQPLARAGGIMARCAAPDRFDAVLDALFKAQATRVRAGQYNEWLAEGAAAGGMTAEQVNACFADTANLTAFDDRVIQSRADGVRGTPTFLINGRPAEVWDVDSLATAIQPLLN